MDTKYAFREEIYRRERVKRFFSLLACIGAKLLLMQASRLKKFLSTSSHDSPEGFEGSEGWYINNYNLLIAEKWLIKSADFISS